MFKKFWNELKETVAPELKNLKDAVVPELKKLAKEAQEKAQEHVREAHIPAWVEIEVVEYEKPTLTFRCAHALPTGVRQATALLPNGQKHRIHVAVETYLPDKEIYWGSMVERTLDDIFAAAFRKDDEESFFAPKPAQAFVERRQQPRKPLALTVASRGFAQFQAVTYDLSPAGLRLLAEREQQAGQLLSFRLETAGGPIDVQARVVWCQAEAGKGFWVGMQFHDLGLTQAQAIQGLLR